MYAYKILYFSGGIYIILYIYIERERGKETPLVPIMGKRNEYDIFISIAGISWF